MRNANELLTELSQRPFAIKAFPLSAAYRIPRATTSSVPKAGGDKRVVSGAFLRIYRRQPDGQWRMTRDMFNTDGTQRN